MHDDLFEILQPFIKDEKLKNNQSLLEEYFFHERDRHNSEYGVKSVQKYSLEDEQLSDEDIINLCDLYWMDYICFPFDMPKQCDIKKLLNDHYGKEVVYKPCY